MTERSLAIPLIGLLLCGLSSCVTSLRRATLTEENDLLSSGAGRDRDYSQGLRLAWEADQGGLVGRGAALVLQPLSFLDPILGEPAPNVIDRHNVQVFLEQRIYNPIDLDATSFVPGERPYAGILQLGVTGRHVRLDPDPERRRDWRHETTVAIGGTGDWSVGEYSQRGAHFLLGEADAAGWQHQIDEEILVQTAWDLRQRTVFGRAGRYEYDVVSGGRVELGTAFTNAQLGFEIRTGVGLPRDARPWVEALEQFSWNFSTGANLRLVAHDLTLDGSLWNNAPDAQLTREDAVYQWWFGLSGRWRGFTLSYRFLRQTREYDEEIGYHDWGSIALGYSYAF